MKEKTEKLDIVEEFNSNRERLNKLVLERADIVIKRFFSLDSQTYREGALKPKIKEMLGLVSSLVLRCDDCIKYHLNQCFNYKVTTSELMEVLSIGLIVGGSIVIPHLRRACEYWVVLEEKRFKDIIKKIESKIKNEKVSIKESENKKNELLQFICDTCTKEIPYYNWFGFYLVDKNEKDMLILGPFNGEPTEHVKIPFGRGICGQAAAKKDSIIVDNINKENNYLACSIKVKSELVVPIIKNQEVLGEIDIDSHYLNAFSQLDKEFNEKLAEIISNHIY